MSRMGQYPRGLLLMAVSCIGTAGAQAHEYKTDSGSGTVASLVGCGVQGGDRALQGTHSVGGHGMVRTGDIQERQPSSAGVGRYLVAATDEKLSRS